MKIFAIVVGVLVLATAVITLRPMWTWFLELPWYFRYGVGLLLVGLGVLAGLGGRIRGGATLLGVGIVMLLFASRSQAEKNGYRNY